MILNQMVDILWQTAAAVEVYKNKNHKKCINIQVKVFWDNAMQMLCLQKISYMNYITYIMKIRDLFVEDLCVETFS